MKKINLNKQEVFKLSDSQQAEVVGGGIKRSRRLAGDCAYSRKHPFEDKQDGVVTGCHNYDKPHL